MVTMDGLLQLILNPCSVGVRGLHDKRGTTKLGKKHVMQAFDTQKVTRVVTYQSLTRWYRKVLDRGIYSGGQYPPRPPPLP